MLRVILFLNLLKNKLVCVTMNVRAGMSAINKKNDTYQGEKVGVAIFQTCAVSLVILVRHGCVMLNIFTREVKTISTLLFAATLLRLFTVWVRLRFASPYFDSFHAPTQRLADIGIHKHCCTFINFFLYSRLTPLSLFTSLRL